MKKSDVQSEKIDQEEYQRIKTNTWLSPRETEIYLLHVKEDMALNKVAEEELDTSPKTVYTQWRNIKDKYSKSRATTELDVSL